MVRSRRTTSWRVIGLVTALLLIPQSIWAATPPEFHFPADTPQVQPGTVFPKLDEEQEERLEELDFAILSRKLAGDRPLSIDDASKFRSQAAHQANVIRKEGIPPAGPDTFQDAWSNIGPAPIGEIARSDNSLVTMNGRIGALAIRPSTGEIILGGAQGGIWIFDGTWHAMTDDLPSLAIGAISIAPSDDSIIYAGTGEGALSGDSYFGNGVMKSTDGGHTWSHVSGDYFIGVSMSRLLVDPNNANHLYAAVLRGRGGARRTSPAQHSKFGIWESLDGGTSWTLIKEAPKNTNGATDLEMDPINTNVMYTSFWGDRVYKSTDGGHHWAAAMNGLPNQFNAENLTRFSIGLSHPAGHAAVLYVGTDFIDAQGHYQQSRLFRSDDEAGTWHELPVTSASGDPDDSVIDYCGQQCYYDNVIEPDPTNADIVFAAGQFGYDMTPPSGGLFRSDDGGQTWKNLGWDLHPDYHAFAFNSEDTSEVVVGSDGGVWWSGDRGGRLPGAEDEDDLTAADWASVNPGGLAIAQFTSIATNPSFFIDGQTPRERMWGGTQDNGTMRKSALSNTWFDAYSGDGGQVLVDPTDWHYVYGTYFGISPYRDVNGGSGFFENSYIRTGINLNDRSDFYAPWVLNKDNPDQLFLGTYRLYRTDNAKADNAVDVTWNAISPDLTSGCTGEAPNGARNCTISAIGIGGGDAVYTGSLDGYVYLSTDAQVNDNPTWTRLDQNGLPKRPVSQIAVDRSNYRIAYLAYNGFNAGTPGRPGHLFKTTDGGASFINISGNLPDSPVNSVILDPSYPNTLYVGTDVGPFVSYNGGVHWSALGTGFPVVSIWQLDLDTGAPAGVNGVAPRRLLAGTHGRGAFKIDENTFIPAFEVTKVDAGTPVGPSKKLDYTITVKNIGNADATGVSVSDPIPADTAFASADHGGTASGGKVRWSGLSVAAGDSVNLHFSVNIASALKKKVGTIVNDGIVVSTAAGIGTTGSPTITHIAPPYAVALTPASQTAQERPGSTVNYELHLRNLGYNDDSYTVTADGTFPSELLDGTCTDPVGSTVGPLGPGQTEDLCVAVTIPADAANNAVDVTTVTATSVGSPSVTDSATLTTTAAAADTLLVDGDGDAPDVQSFYADALTAANIEFNTWDLRTSSDLPSDFLNSYTNVVWFTGNSYPGPILPYEDELASFLDNGGRLFMNGQDILDQAAGTTDFVHDYLHIDWDGSENQNDKQTEAVHGVEGNVISDGIDEVELDHEVLGAEFEDQITPIDGAEAAFTDDASQPDALNVDTGTYKVVFLAFPFEAYGEATDKTDLMERVFAYFGS
jgi:photosystem II stability/assembly factor-like uncharacterized protein